MKILNSELSELEKEMIEEDMNYNEIKVVKSKEEANEVIKNHFGTLKCAFDKYDTDEGKLWVIYPPKGVYGLALNLLIK